MSDLLQPIGGLQPVGGGEKRDTPVQPTPAMSAPPPPMPAPVSAGPIPASNPVARNSYPPVQEEDPDRAPQWLVILGACFAVVVLVAIVIPFLPSAPVSAPKEYKTFVAANQAFSCDLPAPWKMTAMGDAAAQKEASLSDGVIAKESDASVEVTVSSVAGLVTGQLLYGDSPVPAGMVGSRSAPIFRAHGRAFKKHYKNFKETKLEMPAESCPPMTTLVPVENSPEMVPDIRFGEFTADGKEFGMGGKRHGYRMTVGGIRNIVHVVCECSERDWPKLKPAFEHTLASVQDPGVKKTLDGIAIPGGGSLPTTTEIPGMGNSGFGGTSP